MYGRGIGVLSERFVAFPVRIGLASPEAGRAWNGWCNPLRQPFHLGVRKEWQWAATPCFAVEANQRLRAITFRLYRQVFVQAPLSQPDSLETGPVFFSKCGQRATSILLAM